MQLLRRMAIILSCLSFAGMATAQQAPLPMDEAFRPSLSRISPTEIAVNWQIEPGYYLYREYLAAKNGDGSPITLETEPGRVKEDPGFGSTEVYYDTASAKLVGEAAIIDLTYQGCQDGGLCYPPVTKTIDASLLQFDSANDDQASAVSPGSTSSANEWARLSTETAEFSLAQDTATSGVETLLARGGLPLLLLGFVGFGVLLAFTPCVFPMYPIVAAMLSREGESLSPKRGLLLSSVYVGALALAFGLFGLVAAWSGQNLQFALQSSAATLVIAGLFLALALANFGLFELQVPATISSRLASQRSRGGSLGGAATLGFTSAFLIGPCVTAPLAGAFLYIARTGDTVVGAAALFALGIGKGIPLIAMATIGGKALPRAGAWMASIRSAFGFGFMGTAVWMISPLLPVGIVLLAWACLAVTVGIFLAQLHNEGAPAGIRILARSAAVLSIVWGALLLVGVGLGAHDPLAPLEPLRVGPDIAATAKINVTKSDFGHIASTDDLRSKLAEARADDKPSLIYVTADWCITCRGIERSILPADRVSAALGGVNLLTIDMTSTTPATQQLLASLKAIGPPTMIFFDRDSREVAGTRLVGEVTVNRLASSALTAKSARP